MNNDELDVGEVLAKSLQKFTFDNLDSEDKDFFKSFKIRFIKIEGEGTFISLNDVLFLFEKRIEDESDSGYFNKKFKTLEMWGKINKNIIYPNKDDAFINWWLWPSLYATVKRKYKNTKVFKYVIESIDNDYSEPYIKSFIELKSNKL